MEKRIDFTSGKIVVPLLKFAGPVFLALFLQAMYGAVDLLIVGEFASSADVSAVSTGSQIMMTITNLISSFCMAMTIFLGQKIGERKANEGGQIIGTGLLMFTSAGMVLTVILPLLSPTLTSVMHAPEEAYELTVHYIRICGGGAIVIIAYNLIGGIFRGIGDSNTPLVTVTIACVCNIVGDLFLVGRCHMGTVGVAEKVCAFIMLVPAAFMQSMSAFVAQNRGAGKKDRIMKGLTSAIGISFAFGVFMFYLAFFHGDMLAGVFSNDGSVIRAAADYLKAYAIDCLLTCFLFCFIGFFNGMECTSFVMIQGIVGAFAVRVPVSYLMSRWEPVSLFHIGLATPCSTVLQITLCFLYLIYVRKNAKMG